MTRKWWIRFGKNVRGSVSTGVTGLHWIDMTRMRWIRYGRNVTNEAKVQVLLIKTVGILVGRTTYECVCVCVYVCVCVCACGVGVGATCWVRYKRSLVALASNCLSRRV